MVPTAVDNDHASEKKFVLVVDRNKPSSAGIKSLLKQFHYKAWCVDSAAEALELCDIVMPALVIVHQIDDMTHPEFVSQLKQLDSSGEVSILVAAGKKDEVDERACLAAGAVTCLKLPLKVETLYRTIQVAIESVPRMNIRINTKLPIVLDDKSNSQGKFATTLSESGLFLQTSEPCPLKSRVHLKLKVAGRIVSADAVVIYAHKQGRHAHSKPGMGLQFMEISDRDQEHIRSFISEEIKKGISVSERT